LSADGKSCDLPTCAIGDIYYSDGSCTSAGNYNTKKKAVGVVFMLTDSSGYPLDNATSSKHGRVINLRDLYADSNYLFNELEPYSGLFSITLAFGLPEITIPSLIKYSSESVSTSGSLAYALKNNVLGIYDGKSNTKKIIAAVSSTSCSYSSGTYNYAKYCRAPAAEAANAFYPPNVSSGDSKVGAGKWYLPSIGELAYLHGIDTSSVTTALSDSGALGTTYTIVNNTLLVLKGRLGSSYAEMFTLGSYWSSSAEDDTLFSWILAIENGSRNPESRDFGSRTHVYVRAVLAF
jgi:hypothetical protein